MLAPQSHLSYVPLESLPVAMAGLDANGTIIKANSRFLKLFGIDKAKDGSYALADLVAGPYRTAVQEALDEIRTRSSKAPAHRIKVQRSTPPAQWLAIETARLGSLAEFPYVVCARAILRGCRFDMEAWPTLLTTLSHELRGSINAIRGWVNLAESGALPADRIPRAFSIIGRNAENLWGLIENLFDLSRNAAGSLALKRELVDFNQLVAQAVESAYPAAERHGVALSVKTSPTPLRVNGDRIRLEQVVRNLVDNAIKFTPKGGQVSLQTDLHPPFGELVVDDTGVGISPELLPAIFDPFRRGGLEIPQADVGVGLGLALVRELVELHRGEIHASSKGKGQGSTFIVKLPLADGPRPLDLTAAFASN